MSDTELDLARLRDPFPPMDIEWRVGRAGMSNGKPWAKVLAYITARAIMDRLDEVCGPDGWQVEYRFEGGHMHAGIGIRVGDERADDPTPPAEWVWKWDGSGTLDSGGGLSAADAGKGDFSNALKRAGVAWGIGRYLYNLDEGWASIHEDGRFYQGANKAKGIPKFNWDPPPLPAWALPEGTEPLPQTPAPKKERAKAPPRSAAAVKLQDLINTCYDAELISWEQACAAEEWIEAGDDEAVAEMTKRLEVRLAKAKLGGEPEKAGAA